MSKATVDVPGIHCDHCKSSIEGALTELAGVREADVSVEARNVTVDYDEDQIDLGRIRDTIIEQGYDLPA